MTNLEPAALRLAEAYDHYDRKMREPHWKFEAADEQDAVASALDAFRASKHAAKATPPAPDLSELERECLEAALENRSALKGHVHAGCPVPQSKRVIDAQYQFGKKADALLAARTRSEPDALDALRAELVRWKQGSAPTDRMIALCDQALAERTRRG